MSLSCWHILDLGKDWLLSLHAVTSSVHSRLIVYRTTHHRGFPTFPTWQFDELRRKRGTPAHTVQQIPIEDTIINIIVVFHDLGKQLSQEIVVGSFLETKFTDIIQIDTKFLLGTGQMKVGAGKFSNQPG